MSSRQLLIQFHQPYRLRRLYYFENSNAGLFFDMEQSRAATDFVVRRFYIPIINALKRWIKEQGQSIQVRILVSGILLEQCSSRAQGFLKALSELVHEPQVEFCANSYFHALPEYVDTAELAYQVSRHARIVESVFGVSPVETSVQREHSQVLIPERDCVLVSSEQDLFDRFNHCATVESSEQVTPNRADPVVMSRIQNLAISKLMECGNRLKQPLLSSNPENGDLLEVWRRLLSVDHFHAMAVNKQKVEHSKDLILLNSYDSPYEAFINFMNILRAIERRLEVGSKLPMPLHNHGPENHSPEVNLGSI